MNGKNSITNERVLKARSLKVSGRMTRGVRATKAYQKHTYNM